MELRQLRYFVTVAAECNVTRAAERLHMAQQPLSVAIRKLEADLAFDLFERTANRLSLTPAGAAFLPEALTLLAAADTAVERGRDVARGERGRLRIGFCSAAMGRVLPPAIAAFRAAHPVAQLQFRRLDQPVQLAALERAEIDLAFVYRPFDDELHASVNVLAEALWIALPRAHPAASRSSLEVAELAYISLVRFVSEATAAWRSAGDRVLRDAAVVPVYAAEAADAETGVGLAAAGVGGVILTEYAARTHARDDIAMVALETPYRVELAAVWNRRDSMNALRDRFIDSIVA